MDLTVASVTAGDTNTCVSGAYLRLVCWGSNTARESFGALGAPTREPVAAALGLASVDVEHEVARLRLETRYSTPLIDRDFQEIVAANQH